ncbi:uncharacterized protein LOC130899313 [Diorhabda carinulata]|uniref:uncharacterized protein LOC130899313 n=1 Tax=Diorhabda carinulata TaxID=1163345 RepID=UPI0025A30203|nr:uncharacterized protein LOC130899313 [Diorhabda carinulata]
MNVENNVCGDKLTEERCINLQSALSGLSSETGNPEFLENIKTCMGFMSTFDISEVEQQLLQWVLPVLKNTLQKAFDDNFLLSDTCEDDFVLKELSGNLKLISQLLEILKEILEFIVKNSEIHLHNVENVVVVSVQVISLTFDHYRKSPESFKEHFNQDLLDIFDLIQNVHSLYFQFLEQCELPTEEKDVEILLDVLDNLVTISENLFSLNLKSLVINWKGYVGVAIKFSNVLKDRVDLKRPTLYITTLICDRLLSTKNPYTMQLSNTQIIQISGFLVKVALKLFETFWDNRNNFMNDIMEFCCSVYSFIPKKFSTTEFPVETSKLIEDTIFVHTKPFIRILLLDDFLPKAIVDKKFISGKYCFGFLNILNTCVEILISDENCGKNYLETLIRSIFQCINTCYEEFFWPINIFDDLVINISAAVMIHDDSYEIIEIILLENILQEEIINYLLATEIWCLLLRNSKPHFRVDVFTNLIKIYSQLDFGKNTHRLENVYLLSFIRRAFEILPDYLKCQIVQSVDIGKDVWKRIGFKYFPKQMASIIECVYSETLELIEKLNNGDFGCKELVFLVENFNSLSTVNYEETNIPRANLLNAIDNVWKLEFTDTTNNLFKYFIVSFFKITTNFLLEFNNKQLYSLLNHLTHLSTIDYLKLHICFMLKHFCELDENKLGQDGCVMYKIFSNVLSNILLTSGNIIKQEVLEILEILTKKGKFDVVRDVLTACANDRPLRDTISDFLRRKIDKPTNYEKYLKNLAGSKQKHACVEWKTPNVGGKKIKLDIVDTDRNAANRTKGKLNSFRFASKKPPEEEKPKEKSTKTDDFDDNIDEVISRLKGEVKCLLKVSKTDKLTPKNASDLKILANQLLSLL